MREKEITGFLLENRSKWDGKSPCFIVDEKKLVDNIESLKKFLKGEIAYSHKTNPDPLVIKTIFEKGCSFLISSVEELTRLIKLTHISSEKVVFQSPSVTPVQYKKLRDIGVHRFSIDSLDQLKVVSDSIESNGVTLELMVRVNTGLKIKKPELPYGTDSFLGFPLEEAEAVLKKLNHLRKNGNIKLGIHNHLISQNTYLDMWKKNLQAIADFLEKMKFQRIKIDIMNLGGGYPVEYHTPVPSMASISKLIAGFQEKASGTFPEIHYIFEPGRKTVAEAVALVAKVVHIKKFKGKNVAILDCSLYNCSLDTLIVDLYLPVKKIEKESSGNRKNYIIRGSTPDSLDVFSRGVRLPELKSGDYVAFLKCGAYSFGSDFISLPKAKCVSC